MKVFKILTFWLTMDNCFNIFSSYVSAFSTLAHLKNSSSVSLACFTCNIIISRGESTASRWNCFTFVALFKAAGRKICLLSHQTLFTSTLCCCCRQLFSQFSSNVLCFASLSRVASQSTETFHEPNIDSPISRCSSTPIGCKSIFVRLNNSCEGKKKHK